MSNKLNLGLETLLKIKSEMDVKLDDNLVEACFNIQKKYQFNQDKTLSINAMDHLIEESVDRRVQIYQATGILKK